MARKRRQPGKGNRTNHDASPDSQVKAVSQGSLAQNFKSSNSGVSVMGQNNQVFINHPLPQLEKPERPVAEARNSSQSEQPKGGKVTSSIFERVHLLVESTAVLVVLLFVAAVVIWIVIELSAYPLFEVTSNTLPHLFSKFTGRKHETETLVKLLDFFSASPNIVNIVGGPGFGKSTLSFTVGHIMLKRGIRVHYVNLRQIEDVEAASFAIFAAVDSRNALKSEWDPEQLRFWAASQRRYTVIILDNCDDLIDKSHESFLELISGTVQFSSVLKILLTSQQSLKSSEKEISKFRLKPLRNESSLLLLTNMFSGLSSAHAESFVRLSGSVPLALKLIGALLQDGVDPQTLADELQKRPIRTLSPQDYSDKEHLSVCIGSAYKRLPNTLRQALATYSLIPGTFDRKAASGVLDIADAEADIDILSRLKNRCLIEYDGRSRYEIHRLIVAFVRETDSNVEAFRLDFEPNFVRHFTTRLVRAAEAYSSDVASKEGLSEFDADQHNFIYLVELLMSSSPSLNSKEFARTKVNLAAKAIELFRVRLPRQRLIRLYDSALLSIPDLIPSIFAVKWNDPILYEVPPEVICELIYATVDFHYQTKNKAEAEAVAKQTGVFDLLQLCDKSETTWRVKILHLLCFEDVEDARVNISSAFQCHQQNSIWLKVKDVTSSLFSLGEKYKNMGYQIEAALFFQHYLKTCEKTAQSKDSVDLLEQQAEAYIWLLKNLNQLLEIETKEEAISILEEYVKISPGDLQKKAQLARYLYDLDRLDGAEAVARSVVKDYEGAYNNEDVYDLIAPLTTLCFILRKRDDDARCDEFIAVCNRSYTISLNYHVKPCAPTVNRLRTLAKAVRRCKGDELAVPYYRHLVNMQYSVTSKDDLGIVDSLLELIDVLYQSSQYSEYFRVCREVLMFSMNMEGALDLPFESNSTDVASQDKAPLSEYVSKVVSAFPASKRVTQAIYLKKNVTPLLAIYLFAKAPLLYIPFCICVLLIFVLLKCNRKCDFIFRLLE